MKDDFEKQLQSQAFRPIPASWKASILATAAPATPAEPMTVESTPWWRALLWPCPQAWAGVAAAWVAIFFLNREPSNDAAVQTSAAKTPAASQLILARNEKQKLMAELLEPSEPPEVSIPGPRSEGFSVYVVI